MSGSVGYGGQSVDSGAGLIEQGVGTVSGTGIANYDASDLPVIISADPNLPERKPSPDGVSTIVPNFGQVALNSSTATLVKAANTNRQLLNIRNMDAAISIYVGGSGVTSSTGYLLRAYESIDVKSTAAIYAISASATPTCCFLEETVA